MSNAWLKLPCEIVMIVYGTSKGLLKI